MSRSSAIWALCLVLLLLNDHVLKHAGVLPSWFTGKLSDFAGLVVAPVLAAALLRARRAVTRAAAFAPVVAVFCAVKLSPSAARAVEHAVGWLGIHWRLWCDPTDLVALLVLPLAFRLDLRALRAPRLRRGIAIMVGGAACLATSVVLEGFRTAVYLVNRTESPLEIRVHRARLPIDCANPAGTLTATDFDAPTCQQLDVERVLPLDRNWSALRSSKVVDGGPGGTAPPCDAMVLRTPGLPDTLLVWGQLEPVDILDPFDAPLDAHGIYLERAGERLFAAGTPLITSLPVSFALPDACGALDGGAP
jgi:hypothetical protein